MTHSRPDPSDIGLETIVAIFEILTQPEDVSVVDDRDRHVELPPALRSFFRRIARLMQERPMIVRTPEKETFTTQAAADYLGVPRQHFVDLLEGGRIPFHKVGSHRRVYFRDLLAYERAQDAGLRKALIDLAKIMDEAGFDDLFYTGDDEG